MEPRRHEPLDPMLSPPNCRLALAPVAKPGATPAHDVCFMQSKDPSTPAATSADELQEDDARAHANANHANLARDWGAIISL
jgi:hypothetical protein